MRKGPAAGRVFPVFASRRPTTLGREGQVDAALGDPKTSRRHAAIFMEQGRWILEDLQSSNGTFLQGKRIHRDALPDGSTIQVGATLVSFHPGELAPPPELEVRGTRPAESVGEDAGVLVFRAAQPAMDREARLDWLPPTRELEDGEVARVRQAVEEAQRLSGESIVPVVHAGAGGEEGTFVILRGPPGPSLEQRLGEVLALPLGARVEILRSLVELALERATWEGLRYPFGLRHVVSEGGLDAPRVRVAALDLGALLAEIRGDAVHVPQYAAYLAPECQDGHGADAGADGERPLARAMYNLGAIGYHLLTGQLPMGDGDVATVLENHRRLEPAPAALLEGGIPASLSAILERMLAKDPRRRPGGRHEVLSAFPAPAAATPAPAAPPAARAVPPRTAAAPARSAAPPPRKPEAAKQPEPAARPAPPAPAPRPAAVPRAARAMRKAPVKAPLSSQLLYLPIWGILWVALFLAARFLSRLVFRELGG